MVSEQFVLRKFIDSRDDYEKYGPMFLMISNLEREVDITLSIIDAYYNKYVHATSIGQNEILSFYNTVMTKGMALDVTDYVNSIYELDIQNEDLTLDIVESIIETHISLRIVDRIAPVIDGKASGVLKDIENDLSEYTKIIRAPSTAIVPFNEPPDQVIDKNLGKMGLPSCSNMLTSYIKGFRRKTLGLIFAYVDIGKSSFGIANMAEVAKTLHAVGRSDTVAWATNEEEVERVATRLWSSITGQTNEELVKNKTSVIHTINQRGWKNVRLFDHVTNMGHIEKILDRYVPRVLFIDQGTKVLIGKEDTYDVNALINKFNMYRELAKVYDCTIICCAQADSDTETKKHLQLRDLYGSKSGIQGELDWACGIGIEEDIKYASWRYFNLCKNKFGDKGNWGMRFNASVCQFQN